MNITSIDTKHSDTDTSSDFGRPTFRFPPAPRLCRSANGTSRSISCNSDSSASDSTLLRTRRRNRRRYVKPLPPIGVFWDIENCQVPKNKSASSIVQKIRELFFDGYREAEFIVVCDVKKENAQIIQDLHDAQVNLIHVSSTSKNAADEKLRQSLRRFAETHSAPSAVVLISGDINFAGDLSDLRYRKKIQVILVHNSSAADALISCANKSYAYASLTENLPLLKTKISSQYEILIENLPSNCEMKKLRNRLNRLSDNCGGKVVNVDIKLGTAVLVFSNYNFAIRAQRRLRGEDVFGYKIRLSNPTNVRDLPARNFSVRPPKSVEGNAGQSSGYCSQDGSNYYSTSQNSGRDSWKYSQEQDGAKGLPNIPQENLFVPIRPNPYTDQRSATPMDESMGACGVSYPNRTRPNSTFTSEDEENAYQNFKSSVMSSASEPVELVISNLDPSLNLKRALTNLLKEYVMVVGLTMTSISGSPIAIVQLASQQEAQYVISQLHHYKLGSKKIVLSYVQNKYVDPGHLREAVIGVLKDVPGKRMPLFQLIELLESRYYTNVSVSELSKLKDITRIEDCDHGGRIISLTPEFRSSPSTGLNMDLIQYCAVHCPNGLGAQGWYEAENVLLPNINMSLQTFSSKLNSLLSSHMDLLPLLSFPICYQSVFEELLPEDENGVPLEHLVTCIKDVSLNMGGPRRNIKYIMRSPQNTESTGEDEASLEAGMESMSQTMRSNIITLSRELIEILKTTERCQLPLWKFIPAYHNHFGRQCRVADYGFVKLIDLLQSQFLSKVIQIMGDGVSRVITLTHSTQIRRFTSDLLKVIKAQQRKPITLSEFPLAYERAIKKPFNPVDYGLCQLEDLLNEVPKHVAVVSKENEDEAITISIPKRVPTAEQIVRTKQFAEDVVKLLYHTPQCAMIFNKFVPAYHHHFGFQCKVSDYGFTKLIDLFEAIPDTVRVEELPDGERKVCLTTHTALKILGSKIRDIVKNSKLASLPLASLPGAYLRQYGCSLRPQTYECDTITELISKLGDYVEIAESNAGPLLVLTDAELDSTIAMRLWALLLQPPYVLSVTALIAQYKQRFHSYTFLARLEALKDVVTIIDDGDNKLVQLTAFYILAAQFYYLLFKAGGRILYGNLENMYKRTYKKSICYDNLDVNGLEDLIGKMNFAFIVRCSWGRTTITLNQQLSDYGIPLSPSSNNKEDTEGQTGVAWPPPPPPPPLPTHDLLLEKRQINRGGPPKPDTPPAVGSSSWNAWSSPENSPVSTMYTESSISHNQLYDQQKILSIQMPLFRTPKLLSGAESLISPMKTLLPAYSMFSTIASPHPTEVPMPDKLLGKDESNDSGVVNNSNPNSETEMDSSVEKQTGTKPKILSSTKSHLKYT